MGSGPVDRTTALALVVSALRDAEDAIHSHPAETSDVYESARIPFEEGMDRAVAAGAQPFSGLSHDEARVVMRYLFASAFMSAWWRLEGDRTRKDRATASATLLVVAVGVHSEDAIHRIERMEESLGRALEASGVAPFGQRSAWKLTLVLLALAMAAYLLFFRP